MRVRVLLPFWRAGQVQAAGTEIELPDDQAFDLLARQRVTRISVSAPAPGPMSTTSTPALMRAPASKGRKNHAQ